MSNIAISFEHVSKMYQLGTVGTGTISNDLKRWWQMSVLGKEDPFLRVGQTNDRTKKGSSEFVYALRDIDFLVERGDVVGIIGKNGAGKSTLLKLLSRITAPTTGYIKAKGRIASLLEVGTGFHPELTGRQNIYMNGAIMGMRKHEIDRKLDEIVDFSGVELYLDTPTKRYSSGMTVRLGFAVAAFLEPEILVVDEVLAVGDAEFQKKAIGKMQDVSKGQGRTVLFVSHNMASVRALCNHGIVLKNGMVDFVGTVDVAVRSYLEENSSVSKGHIVDSIIYRPSYLSIESIQINGTSATESVIVSNQESLNLEIVGSTTKELKYDIILTFKSLSDAPLASFEEGHYKGNIEHLSIGPFRIKKTIKLPKYLAKGDCKIDLVMHHPNVEYLLQCPNCAILHMDGNFDGYGSPLHLDYRGFCGL